MHVPGAELVTDVRHHVRQAARLGPGRPAVWLGLRTAAAMGAPLLVSPWLPPGASTWAPLAGFAVALVDKGGAYKSRATGMLLVALGSLVAVAAGTLAAGNPILAIIVVTLGVTACAFSHAWGPARAGIGNTIALHLTVAAFLPAGGSLVGALLGVALGSAWAMLLGLVVWPVRLYKPGRRALAAALSALATQARALVIETDRDALVRRHREIRVQLELARETLVATRRGRRGETGRGERLLAIVNACEHVFGILVGLEELIAASAATAPPSPPPPPLGATGTALIHALGATSIAPGVGSGLERAGDELARLSKQNLVESWRRETPAVPDRLVPDRARTAPVSLVDHEQHLAARLASETRRIAALVDSLADDSEPSLDVLGDLGVDRDRTSVRERVGAELDLDSAVLRHALRAAICVAIASTIAAVMHLERGYWITLTTFILLQPHRAATTTRAIQRGLGTVAGALVAALVTYAVADPRAIIAIVIVLAGVGASIAQLNYGLFSLFVTPTFILLAELHTHDYGLVWIRVTYTLLAGAIAATASALLWPAREDARFADELATALRACARYAEAIRTAIAAGSPPGAAGVITARRTFGLAINNAELALDRVVADRIANEVVEPAMAMVVATRRLGGALGILGSSRAFIPDDTRATLASLATTLAAHLASLAGAVEHRTLPPPPPAPIPIADAVLAARWARIDIQVAALARSAARAALDRGV